MHLGGWICASLGRAGLRGLTRRPKADVLEHRHVAEQRVVLEHEADLAVAHVDVGGVLAAEHLAGRPIPAGDDAQQRGLAAARRPEKRDQLAESDAG